MPTAFILTRYSTDNQNPDTTAVQVKKCAEYCQQHQLTVLDIFSDEAVSGMKQHRPEYDRMMAAYQAKAGADVVVIYDQSRMFRDMVEWFNFRRQLQALGARVVSVTQPLVGGDLLDPSVFVSESTMAMFNHLHVLITRQKVIEKMRYMALQGKCPGGRPPLGYDLDADRHYIINEFEAETVRRIFTMHAAGAGYGEIITAMAAQGRLTKAGRPFGKNSLHEVLKNEKYIGVLVYGAVPSVSPTGRRNNHQEPAEGCVRLEGAVPRIISDELWTEVQKRMKERTHLGGRYSAKAEYLLSGKVFCGECGGAMVVAGTSSGARGQRYRYYSCVHKRQTKTCNAKGISVPKLEQLVADAVKRQLASPEGLQNVISAAAQYRDALTQAAAPRTDELKQQLQEVTKKIRNLVDTLASGISSKAITDQLAELEDEKARLEAAERNIKAATREVGLTDAEIAEGLTKLSLTDEKTQEGRRVLLSIVAKVVVFADHVDVYTILGPDGKKPDLDTAAKDFITTMGQTSLAPNARPLAGRFSFAEGSQGADLRRGHLIAAGSRSKYILEWTGTASAMKGGLPCEIGTSAADHIRAAQFSCAEKERTHWRPEGRSVRLGGRRQL